MYNRLPEILTSILNIIDYPGNRKVFIDEFQQLCRQQAVLDLISSLPKNEQEDIKQQVATMPSPEVGKQRVMAHFTNEQYQQALEKATQTGFKKYITDMIFASPPEQKKALQAYLQSLPNLQ